MSEIIDLESNNLCTTEDAFEKFQAVSMYEEDEFITLSDIVSPSQPSTDVLQVLSEVRGEETSVSLQNSRQFVESATCSHEKKFVDVSKCNPTVDKNITMKTVKKRGRKKKNSLGNNNDQNGSKEQVQIKQSTTLTLVDNNTTLPTSTDDLNYDMVIEEDNTPLPTDNREEVNKKLTRNIKRISCNSEILDIKDSNVTSISKRQRGRPRINKNIVDLNNVIVSDNESKKSFHKGIKQKMKIISGTTEPDGSNVFLISNDDSSNLSLKKGKKKSLKNIATSAEDKDLCNDPELNDEDIPLVALSNKSKVQEMSVNTLELGTNTEERTLNDSSVTPSQETDFLIEKSPKKRGRPKKNNANNTSDNKLSLDLKEPEQNIFKDAIYCESLRKLVNEQIKSQTPPNIDNDQPRYSKNIQELETPLPNETTSKRSLKKPTMSDFEYNVDSIIKQNEKSETENLEHAESLTKEYSRPVRRRTKINFDYDEGSDEDPYANIELSDDEPPRRKKGSRYFSDDEYFPGKYIPGSKRNQTNESDSEIEVDTDKSSKIKKKRVKRLDSGLGTKSSKKTSHKANEEKTNSQEESSVDQGTIDADVDAEIVLDTTVIKSNEELPKKLKEDNKKSSWGESNEFENFLAKIVQGTDIKIKKANPIDNEKVSLQIPVLDPTEVNKKIEMCTQTNIITKQVAVQTKALYDIPMKNQIVMTAEQSEKACEFLTGIVKTTSELGQLMTQKSEDFIEKKINTKHVTDTFKLDYCVKKSFLLFKLAKHNLVQMEEDLSKHYEEFLKENDLIQHREEQKIIASTSKSPSDDSDCEIVEEPEKELKKQKGKPSFNPKTVFLNKELSIKIAKKPTAKPKPKEKLNIKGRHTVWINDSVMVKKITPTQSFLAQDSRNKKPPDTFITLEMVSDFFNSYNRQKALQICAPYVGNEWGIYKNYTCCYFFENAIEIHEHSQMTHNEQVVIDGAECEPTDLNDNKVTSESKKMCPKSLSVICIQVLEKNLYLGDSILAKTNQDLNLQKVECTNSYKKIVENVRCQKVDVFTVGTLKSLCYNTIEQLMCDSNFSEIENKICITNKSKNVIKNDLIDIMQKVKYNSVNSLLSLCVELMQKLFKYDHIVKQKSLMYYKPQSLKKIVFDSVKSHFSDNIENNLQKKSQNNKHNTKFVNISVQKCLTCYNPKPLKHIVFDSLKRNLYDNVDRNLPQKCQTGKNETMFGDITDQKSTMYYNPHSLKKIVCDLVKSVLHDSVDRNLQQKCQTGRNETMFGDIMDKKSTMYHNPHSLKKIVFDLLKSILHDGVDRNLQQKCQTGKNETMFGDITDQKSTMYYNPHSLKKIVFDSLKHILHESVNRNLQQKCQTGKNETMFGDITDQKSTMYYNPHSLKKIVFDSLKDILHESVNRNLQQKCQTGKNETMFGDITDQKSTMYYNPHSLKKIVFDSLKHILHESVDRNLQQECQTGKNKTQFGDITDQKSTMYQNPHPLKKMVCDLVNSVLHDSVNRNLQQKYKESKPNVKTSLQFYSDFISSPLSDYQNLYTNDKNMLPQNTSLKSSALSLKILSLNKIMTLLNTHYGCFIQEDIEEPLNFTIDNVNTISEELFFENTCQSDYEDFLQTESCVDNDEHEYSDESIINYHDEYSEEERVDNNWVSQVQMQELRSCTDTTTTKDCKIVQQEKIRYLLDIKMEPLEDEVVYSSTVKMEPLDVEESNFTSLNLVTTKQEHVAGTSNKERIHRKNSNSYDVDTFEAFVRSNKMILSMCNDENENVFTQSTSRIRKQHEPDIEDNNDSNTDSLNLLIPQNVEVTKGRLMQSSSDEGGDKVKDKNKLDKRKVKSKKNKKNVVQPQTTKENPVLNNDVGILTKRMRDKIRQEEKTNQSSDSEEDVALSLRRGKLKKGKNKQIKPCVDTSEEIEIQCSYVDSTEKIDETEVENFKVKQNGVSKEYKSISNKEVQYNENVNEEKKRHVNSENEPIPSPINEPAEQIECQSIVSLSQNNMESMNDDVDNNRNSIEVLNKDESSLIVDRHGWKCYPIDSKDAKIYQYAYVSLDKLPESFVDTYFRYQDVTQKTPEDVDIDKLTNLNSLHRATQDTKDKNCRGGKENKQNSNETVKRNILNENLQILVKEVPCSELSPSEDERDDNEDNFSVTPPQQNADNCLAKDSLINDDDEECESENKEDNAEQSTNEIKEEGKVFYKTRSGRIVKPKDNVEHILKSEDIMLTADKMMNRELSLLHAPVEIKHEFEDKKDVINISARNTHRNVNKSQVKKEQKEEDDSSSEEEKQWFTTKEKLLKRLQKRQEIPNVDDAKRAKIVSEFIEKRGDNTEIRLRGRPRRRSKRKLLERRKQLKMLSRELFGDKSSHSSIKYSQATVKKGRRNIRKVLDKKSLRRNTVLANMEEFERKQRLTQRQAKLREVLGCEEGVNVVVINDELCLEYDFDKRRPLVSVHSFFTKVMKAHQYEGVKYMWDSCFESVSAVANGAGGGCILAHCMGLGKTLQVLALLHTVLTHPKLNMRRVLVCCPLSTVLNWVDEINKWIGPVTGQIKVFELSKLKKMYERAYQLEDWYNGGGIFIIGYELFRSLTTLDPMLDNVKPTIVNKIRTSLLDPGPDIIICDEGHLLKNDCSVLAVAMSRVVTKRRIVLTGTPMQNNLREYYCMVNFVKPNLLGTYLEYSNRFENPIMNGQHRDSSEEDIKLMKARTHILHKVLEGCLQRQEASVLYPYLPKKHEYTVFISLTPCQRELYNHYLINYTKETKQNLLKDFHVLQKIWTHPQVLHNFLTRARQDEEDAKMKVEKLEDDLVREDLGASEDVKPSTTETWWLPHVADDTLNELKASNKFLVVFQLLDECVAVGDKVLIFSTSLYTMDALEFFLRARAWALGREYYRLDGSVPAEVRQKWCREFNAPNNTTTRLFLISTRAGCLGLNMTAANRVIILDTSWNPAHDIQSIFRVYRFGQKKDCYIYRLVAMGTMEQKIYERSVTKQAVSCRVVDEQQIDRHYNMSELSELYKLDEAGSTVSAGLAAGVRDAALLRVARADEAGAALHAVHEHDSLLRSSESGLNETERAAAWTQFQQEQTATHTVIENAEDGNSKIVMKTETSTDIVPDVSPEAPQPKSTTTRRTKRGRKSATNCSTDSQPSTSRKSDSVLDPDSEEEMIKKIMSILIKHDFHTTKTPQEISNLVVGVRNVVANAKQCGLENANPLIASIAKVLLTKENTPLPELNTNNIGTDVNICAETESMETIIGVPNEKDTVNVDENNTVDDRKRRRNLRMSDVEYVPNKMRRKKNEIFIIPNDIEKPNTRKSNINTVYTNPNGETSKTSKLQQPEAVNHTPIKKVINLPLESQSSNFTKAATVKEATVKKATVKKATVKEATVKETTVKKATVKEATVKKTTVKKATLKEVTKEKEVNDKPSTKYQPTPDIQNKVINNLNCTEESIVLSDDGDYDEPLATMKPTEETPTSSNNGETCEEDSIDPDEIVPLHKSLLTNKNFIKIVAHTYLTENPMLDVDAAFLSAQYSTLAALKEIKATGREITSGPIYDVAVQVLGKSLLKKLQNVRVNTNEAIGPYNIDKQTDSPATSLDESKRKGVAVPVKKVAKQYANKLKLNKQVTRDTCEEKKDKHALNKKTIDREIEPNQQYLVDSDVLHIDDIELPADLPVIEEATIPVSPDLQTVVPVGIFKGPASLHTNNIPSSQDESILPDDDIIISPLSTSQVVTPPVVPNTTKRRNSKQLHVTSVVSKNIETKSNTRNSTLVKPTHLISVQKFRSANNLSKTSFASTTNTETNKFLNIRKSTCNKEETVAEVLNPVASTPVCETICLDSDEEEDFAPTVCNTTKQVIKSIILTAEPPKTSVTTVAKNSSTPTTVENQNKPSPYKVADTLIRRLKPARKSTTVQCSSNTISSSKNCKPADIIRITETGAIEHLVRNDMSSATATSFVKMNRSQDQSSEVPETITGDLNTESQNVREKPTNVKNAGVSVVISSNAKAKISKSLPLLRNLIHIPDDDFQQSNAESTKVNKVLNSDTSRVQTQKDDHQNATAPTSNVSNENIIDLTESLPAITKPIKKLILKKSNLVTIAGTSKDIIINKMGVMLNNCKKQSAPATGTAGYINNSDNKTTKRKNVTITLKKVNFAKLSSPSQEQPPATKKPKPSTSKPLTLQDFDIDDTDDTDDIIELD